MADPLSIVGAGLGAASLILQVTDECIKRYKYFTEASHMPENHRYLRVRLQMEQQRFLSFSITAGLLSAEDDCYAAIHTNPELLRSILLEIKSLFEQFESINGKYVDMVHLDQEKLTDELEPQTTLVDLVCRTQDVIKGRTVPLHFNQPSSRTDRLTAFRDRALSKAKKLRTVFIEPKRLVWVNADQESFETLIRKLGELNSYLIALLDHSRMIRQERTMESSYLEILQLRDDIQSLTTLVQAFSDDQQGFQSNLGCPIEKSKDYIIGHTNAQIRSDEGVRAYFKKLAAIKIHRIGIDEPLKIHAPGAFDGLSSKLDLSSIIHINNTYCEEGLLQRWNGRSIWFEWLSYPSLRRRDQGAKYHAETRLVLLTNLLSKPLPTEFRTPPCLGYVKSRNEYGEPKMGVVFETPSDTYPGVKLLNLRDLLGSKPKPPLGLRISLCKALAECVHHFHAVDWLHKGLGSSKILFFASAKGWQHLARPYVTGLDLSRPEGEPEMTEKPMFDPIKDLYRHPFAQSGENSGPYRKSYDIYSLGIVFLEVACWKPIETLLEFEHLPKIKSYELQRVRHQVLNGSVPETTPLGLVKPQSDIPVEGASPCLQKVADKCGDAFKEIVEMCLVTDEVERPAYRGESNPSRSQRLRVMFEEQILGRLRLLKEAVQGTVGSSTY